MGDGKGNAESIRADPLRFKPRFIQRSLQKLKCDWQPSSRNLPEKRGAQALGRAHVVCLTPDLLVTCHQLVTRNPLRVTPEHNLVQPIALGP